MEMRISAKSVCRHEVQHLLETTSTSLVESRPRRAARCVTCMVECHVGDFTIDPNSFQSKSAHSTRHEHCAFAQPSSFSLSRSCVIAGARTPASTKQRSRRLRIVALLRGDAPSSTVEVLDGVALVSVHCNNESSVCPRAQLTPRHDVHTSCVGEHSEQYEWSHTTTGVDDRCNAAASKCSALQCLCLL